MLLTETTEKTLTGKELRNSILGREPVDFFKYAKASNQKVFEAGKIGTFDKNKSIITKLFEYNKEKQLHLQNITPAFLNNYERHLRSIGNQTNTIGVNMRYFRKIFNDAYREGLIEHKQSYLHRHHFKLIEKDMANKHFPGLEHSLDDLAQYIAASNIFSFILKDGSIVHYTPEDRESFKEWLMEWSIPNIR